MADRRKNKAILSELRSFLNRQPILEDVDFMNVAMIDIVAGRPRPEVESYVILHGNAIAGERGAMDPSINAQNMRGDYDGGFEWYAKGDSESITDKRYRKTARPNSLEDIPNLLPDYMGYQYNDDGSYVTIDDSNGIPRPKVNTSAVRRKLKTPWQLFVDWFELAMEEAGMNPEPIQGFDQDARYGSLGKAKNMRADSPYKKYTDDINAQPAFHNMTDEQFAELEKQGYQDASQIPGINMLKLMRKAEKERARREKEVGGSAGRRGRLRESIDEARKIDPSKTSAQDDIYSMSYVVESLGETSHDAAENFLNKLKSVISSNSGPSWFTMELDQTVGSNPDHPTFGEPTSPTYSRIYVNTKVRAPGVMDWPDNPIELNQLDPETGEEIPGSAKTTIDTHKPRDDVYAAVRHHYRQGDAGKVKAQRRQARSQAAHRTMATNRGDKKHSDLVGLVRTISDKAANSVYEIEPHATRSALESFLASHGFAISLDDLETFNRLGDSDKNKILELVGRANKNYFLELGDLLESTSKWINAIYEGDDTRAALALEDIERAKKSVIPYPETDIQEDINTLILHRRRTNRIRQALREDVKVYSALLLLCGYSVSDSCKILDNQGLNFVLSESEVSEINALGVGVVSESVRNPVLKADKVINISFDRSDQVFSRIMSEFKSEDIGHIDSIIPQPVVDDKGYLRDMPLEWSLNRFNITMGELVAKSKNGRLIPSDYWRD
jgi:hypothetical protein